MSRIRDLLSRTQGEQSQGLQVVDRYKIRTIDGKVAFVQWDKESASYISNPNPIVGVFIGANMQIASFDQQYGSKGGSYTSSHYFTNKDNVKLYSPSGQVEIQGNMEKVNEWANNRRLQLKKAQCVFILTEKGLVEIKTNLTIAIDQLKQNKEALMENMIVLAPKLYDGVNVSKSAKSYLGRLAEQNPPKYADISVGQPITDNIIDDWGLEQTVITWEKYKKDISAPAEVEQTQEPMETYFLV